ncbi:hypothetical protein [Peribacillus loiseleuriae]|uniref:hypothetical protein n=1 Tax=Peribacillus loiseleuriae TaxID=1679170 RepID=UPI003D08C958
MGHKQNENQYLTGILTVYFGTDSVVLAHKVKGRYSYMHLDEGDLIETEMDGAYKSVTVSDVLKTIVEKRSHKHNGFHIGQSLYEGTRARVYLNESTTERMESENKRYAIRELFADVKSGLISQEDAMEMLIEWETE